MNQIPIPDAISMIREVINNYPELLTPGSKTEFILLNLMTDYRDKCNRYTKQDQPIINEILQSLTKSVPQ